VNVPKLVLIGDSTLDNIVWVNSKYDSIPYKLAHKLSTYNIVNYAADGFNSKDVLHGSFPSISFEARQSAGDPFPVAGFESGVFKPLDALRHLKEQEGNTIKYTLLSVGGNDVREILGRMDLLPQRVEMYRKNYPAIIGEIRKNCPNLILMLQYRPSFKDDNYGVYKSLGRLCHDPSQSVVCLNALMEEVYEEVFNLADKEKLPIIDLPNTFDINDSSLYRMQIEPSSKGGDIIVELISHVVQNHDFSGDSRIYWKDNKGVLQNKTNDLKLKVGDSDTTFLRKFLRKMINPEI